MEDVDHVVARVREWIEGKKPLAGVIYGFHAEAVAAALRLPVDMVRPVLDDLVQRGDLGVRAWLVHCVCCDHAHSQPDRPTESFDEDCLVCGEPLIGDQALALYAVPPMA